ncbi:MULTISPECIES: hypothetical protein [Thermus]|jgi:hypothetical protein|uniref:Uncharacterized protein n=1 Tax=Thermus brockianus TaxID=56956 RepID=A0A1J0LSM1_THEBO|nr:MULTISPECIES: hypothetical protein [Thermus]APD08461.1 hypothetical protein A0O31_00239 [Thermus brockianus]BDG16189.1 hypothetical protein TbrSNM41_09230 [Thermus brockianus]
MSLDDLLGLLFLLFFIVLPALQGLRRSPQAPPVFPEDLPLPEPPRPKARPKPRPKPKPALPPSPPPSREGESLERTITPGRERLEVRFREDIAEEVREKPAKKRLLATDRESLLKGVIWHEILKKPKGL